MKNTFNKSNRSYFLKGDIGETVQLRLQAERERSKLKVTNYIALVVISSYLIVMIISLFYDNQFREVMEQLKVLVFIIIGYYFGRGY